MRSEIVKRSLVLLAAAVIVAGGCARQEEVVARVGEDVITRTEFRRILERKARLSGEKEVNDRLKAETANLLVERKLLVREGERRGLRLVEAEVDAELLKYRASFPDEKAFRAGLEREGLDPERLRREIAETLTAERVRGLLVDEVSVAESEARALYEKDRADFALLSRYRVHLVQVESAGAGQSVAKTAATDPAAFERLALEEASPELRRINQMALLTPRDQFPDGLFPLLDRLKPGETGGPVKTARGWFVVRLLERAEGRQLSWEEARDRVTHLLYQERKEQAVARWLADQRKQEKIEIFAGKL